MLFSWKDIPVIMDSNNEKKNLLFEKTLTEAEAFYDSINDVECPYFNDVVAFNLKGIKHIRFKKEKVARSHADQFMRLKYIRLAPRVVEKSKTLQEYKQAKCFEELKSDGKRVKTLQEVRYYGFIAILKDELGRMTRLKVVVKQVAGGKPYFWSIIPFWKNNKDLDRQMHSGDLEED